MFIFEWDFGQYLVHVPKIDFKKCPIYSLNENDNVYFFFFQLLGCAILGVGIWILVDDNFGQYVNQNENFSMLYTGMFISPMFYVQTHTHLQTKYFGLFACL